MKTIKILSLIAATFMVVQVSAQEMSSQTGVLNAVTTNTFSYVDDGVEYPYKVTVREKRAYTAKFDEADINKVNQDRISTPAHVAVLITINNPRNSFDNRVLALRYEKQINDTFEIVPNKKGFAVKVNDKILDYIVGEGVFFADAAHKDFFIVDEFDVLK